MTSNDPTPAPPPQTAEAPGPGTPSRPVERRTRLTTRLLYQLAELLLVGGATFLVAWLGAHTRVFTIDSYYYLAKAKSLASLDLLHVPWGDGVDRKFFWGYSIALALPVKIFGEAGFWVLNAGLHAFTGVVVVRVARMLDLTASARLAALALVMFNPIALWWATVPMSEPLLVALSLAAVFFALRWRSGAAARELMWAALLGGCALLTRAEGIVTGVVLLAIAGPKLLRERRRMLALICSGLFVGPEALHALYLAVHALPGKGLFAYFDEARSHWKEIRPLAGTWQHLRAPYWMIFRYDTEPWLYARYFPGWLSAAQGVVLVLYLASLAAALATRLFKKSFSFPATVGLIAFSALHALWFYSYERFDYLAVPAAALVFAWAISGAFAWSKTWVRSVGTLSLAFVCAAISGAYGVRVSQMHAERLAMHQRGLDYRAIAAAANAAAPSGRFVTDLGPYLAYYLDGFSYFDRWERDFYEDVVPSGQLGRVFLAENRISAIVSTRSPRTLEAELGLVEGEYHLAPAPNVTLMVLDLPQGSPR